MVKTPVNAEIFAVGLLFPQPMSKQTQGVVILAREGSHNEACRETQERICCIQI